MPFLRHYCQSLAVGKAIKEAQLDAKVPAHKLRTLEPTATTRWGNQYSQLTTNCDLRPAIDPAVEKFKRENRNNKEQSSSRTSQRRAARQGGPCRHPSSASTQMTGSRAKSSRPLPPIQ